MFPPDTLGQARGRRRRALWALAVASGIGSLAGCAHRQWVSFPYPRWGQEVQLPRGDRQPPLTLRLLGPKDRDGARACLLLVHGMNEYVGRYRRIARHFAERFLVGAFDFYAHGLSNPRLAEADRAIGVGVPRYEVSDAFLAQIPLANLELLRRDLRLALRGLAAECDRRSGPETPIFLISHSLGSLVAATYLLDEDPRAEVRRRVSGIVLLGPAFSVTHVPGWQGWFANPLVRWSFAAEERLATRSTEPGRAAWARLWAWPTSVLLNGLFEMLSWPGLRLVFTPTTPDWVVTYLTDSEVERARHRADGYIIRRALLRYVKGVEREIVAFRQRMRDFDVPYLVVSSAEDPITPAWGVHDFVAASQFRHADNAMLELPDKNHHEHLFSAPPLDAEILRRIDAWLDRRLSVRFQTFDP